MRGAANLFPPSHRVVFSRVEVRDLLHLHAVMPSDVDAFGLKIGSLFSAVHSPFLDQCDFLPAQFCTLRAARLT